MTEIRKTQLLLVDDDDALRDMLCTILELGGFEVRTASNVNQALKLIGSASFDVLVSDLHMPHEGDGLTVVSAMRHSNPAAVTFISSAYPEMKKAAAAILAQTDEIIVKPGGVGDIVALIRNRMKLHWREGLAMVGIYGNSKRSAEAAGRAAYFDTFGSDLGQQATHEKVTSKIVDWKPLPDQQQ